MSQWSHYSIPDAGWEEKGDKLKARMPPNLKTVGDILITRAAGNKAMEYKLAIADYPREGLIVQEINIPMADTTWDVRVYIPVRDDESATFPVLIDFHGTISKSFLCKLAPPLNFELLLS